MRKHFHNVRDFILPIIDFFYPPFRRLMNLQTFRYAASGGGNMLIGFTTYWLSFELFLNKQVLQFPFFAFKPHSAALLLSFIVTFPIGFFMSKYVVFSDSRLKGRIQLFRYFAICLFNLLLNFILLKILVEHFHIYAIPAQLMTTAIVIVFSYLAQRHFSFRSAATEADVTG